jgi:hypothetical protein
MKLPKLTDPKRYEGLYVFDFEGQVGMGYTGREIEILLESEKYRQGKVYKIQRAWPDGRLEIKGVSNKIFQVESGMFFHGRDQQQARKDYRELVKLAEGGDFPCRAKIHFSRRQSQGRDRYVVALIYPAEYEEEVSQWLMGVGYKGGELASGGISQVEEYYGHYSKIQSQQLWGVLDKTAREPAEVLAQVGKAVVR